MRLQILHGHLRACDVIHKSNQFSKWPINIEAIFIEFPQQLHQMRVLHQGPNAYRRVYSFLKSFFQRMVILPLHLFFSMQSLYKHTVAEDIRTIQHEM
ncbi:hypothetical protein [Salmonella phage VB_ST_SPNIS2]|nr:hypothetical protein [Salmonella phage VB_ST_SPNIS2]